MQASCRQDFGPTLEEEEPWGAYEIYILQYEEFYCEVVNLSGEPQSSQKFHRPLQNEPPACSQFPWEGWRHPPIRGPPAGEHSLTAQRAAAEQNDIGHRSGPVVREATSPGETRHWKAHGNNNFSFRLSCKHVRLWALWSLSSVHPALSLPSLPPCALSCPVAHNLQLPDPALVERLLPSAVPMGEGCLCGHTAAVRPSTGCGNRSRV